MSAPDQAVPSGATPGPDVARDQLIKEIRESRPRGQKGERWAVFANPGPAMFGKAVGGLEIAPMHVGAIVSLPERHIGEALDSGLSWQRWAS